VFCLDNSIYVEQDTYTWYNVTGSYGRFLLSSSDQITAVLFQDSVMLSSCSNIDSYNCLLLGDRVWFGASHQYSILIKGSKTKRASLSYSTNIEGMFYKYNIDPHEYYIDTSLIFVNVSVSWYANILSILLILLIFLCPITFVYCCVLYCGLVLYGPLENKSNDSDEEIELEILV